MSWGGESERGRETDSLWGWALTLGICGCGRAAVLMGHALQGCEGRVQGAVRAGPEGAETVAVQVRVALQCTDGSGGLSLPHNSTKGSGGPGWSGDRLGRSPKPQLGPHTHCQAVVGEKVRNHVATFGGVGGQGGAAEQAGETRGRCDGLGPHV